MPFLLAVALALAVADLCQILCIMPGCQQDKNSCIMYHVMYLIFFAGSLGQLGTGLARVLRYVYNVFFTKIFSIGLCDIVAFYPEWFMMHDMNTPLS